MESQEFGSIQTSVQSAQPGQADVAQAAGAIGAVEVLTVNEAAPEVIAAPVLFKPIPDKLFFRIGDVAELLDVKAYVLRYWETEFPMLSPQKSAAGHRVYRRQDVETLQLIQNLLYRERYSIEGARKRIRELKKAGELKSAREELGAEGRAATDSASGIAAAESAGSASRANAAAVSVAGIASPEAALIRSRTAELARELKSLSQVSVDQLFSP